MRENLKRQERVSEQNPHRKNEKNKENSSMAPKHPENPPMASSSEEEEEESGSSVEESDSSDEENDQPIKNLVHSAAKKLRESDSEEESEPEPAKKKSSAAVTLPESSNKRSSKQTDDDVKAKITREEEEDKKQLMFQRIFSETDEINLLQGILDFTSKRAWERDAFCDYVKELINFNAHKKQLVTKIQRLRKRFANTVKNAGKKGKSEEEIVLPKDLDQKIFELSRKIWGDNGVLSYKLRKKVEASSSSAQNKQKTKKPVAKGNAGNTSVSSAREISSFFMKENASALGLDEATIAAGWDRVAGGPKKREMEEKLKMLKEMQAELCLQRIGLVADSVKLIFK